MIRLVRGNLLEQDVEALVNSVNTVGVMGKGVALQFRQAYPQNYKEYLRACKREEVQPGKMLVVPTGTLANPKYIINFPTKRHWRQDSRLADIEAGLVALVDEVKRLQIHSIALPPLGCGNGGLDWADVRPLIEKAFKPLPNVITLLFVPVGAPDPNEMSVATPRPNMTAGRAVLLGALSNYLTPGYRLALLEIHKMMYFIQVAGEPLGLRFAKDKYGPYAENLNHVLQRVEGHFIRGYGDRTNRGTQIELDEAAVAEARGYLNNKPATSARLERVKRLIEGFETPYGLELLATVHWVATVENLFARTDVKEAIQGVHAWNKRKQETFRSQHIERAWTRLREQNWL